MERNRSLAILGATGSIGRQAMDVAEELGLRVPLVAAHHAVEALEETARRLSPRYAVLTDEAAARDLALRLADTPTEVLGGEGALLEAIAAADADVYLNAILGCAGLLPSLAAVKTGRRLALANKESMVVAGEIVHARAAATGAEILPVDSEHSAIFQSLSAGRPSEVKRLLLTASGGPFRGFTRERLGTVTRRETLAHPTWQMGAKITVDSATLANKGFEVIEAVRLFDVAPEQIEVVVHPESIIHSAVEYIDTTVIAEMSIPDMRSCIRYAITYPERTAVTAPSLDLFALGRLTFERPDREAFPLLGLAYEAVGRGGAAPAILNAADEVAVAAFLRDEIGFLAIAEVVTETLEAIDHRETTLDGILAKDREARAVAADRVLRYKKG